MSTRAKAWVADFFVTYHKIKKNLYFCSRNEILMWNEQNDNGNQTS